MTRQNPRQSTRLLATVGFVIAVASALFGIGGPMLTVPVLVACNTPLLSSLAAAQTQSVVIACVGTVGYLSQGAVSWPLALLIGVPECCGVLIGWKIAHAVPTHRLNYLLIAALLAVAPTSHCTVDLTNGSARTLQSGSGTSAERQRGSGRERNAR